MNFRDLEYVIEVSKTLSFSKAADNCNVSQPSLSTQIKKLESELKTEIFIRNKRNVHLSAFGHSFVAKAKNILEIREDIRSTANKNQNPLEGKVRLGAILTIAPYLFPKIVTLLAKTAPKIELSLKEAHTETLIGLLFKGKIDAAIVSLPTDDDVFETRALFSEPFYLAVSKQHSLAKRTIIHKKDLDGCILTLLEEGHCFRTQALDICHSTTAKENQTFTATSLETIRNFIASSNGATFMPETAIKKNDGLQYIPLKNKNFKRDIGLIWRKSCNKKVQLEQLFHLLESHGIHVPRG